MSDNIVVAVRIRPCTSKEIENKSQIQWKVGSESVIQIDPQSSQNISTFVFDKMFDAAHSNEDIYNEVVSPIIEGALSGFNGTIFAYGQTASGKTHTMTGDHGMPGIIPISIRHIFQIIEDTPDREYLLRMSYMEIYQENIMDLLTKEKLAIIREDGAGNICVPGLEEICVTNENAVFEIIERGQRNRRVAETNMNEKSSRSHAIFKLILESRERLDNDGDQAVTVSHLNMVDLAGSENASQTGATGDRLKEGGAINRSLSFLGRVIMQLSEGEQHINFRDSKLTRILQASLGGNAKTAIICNVTPISKEQTLSTLRFASSAKSIKNKPIINEVLSEAAMLKRCTLEIRKLKAALKTERNTDKAMEVEQVKEKLDEQERKNNELEQKLTELKKIIVVSSHSDKEALKIKSKRRITWAAPGFGRKSKISLCPLNMLDSSRRFFPEPIRSKSSNDSFSLSSSAFGPIPEAAFEQDERSKIEGMDSFVVPLSSQKTKRRRRVNFNVSEIPLSLQTKDVESQTEPAMGTCVEKSVASTQSTPVRNSRLSDSGTPKHVLYERNRILNDELDSQKHFVSTYKEEFKEMREFHELELQSLLPTLQGSDDSNEEIVNLQKSVSDYEIICRDVQKQLFEKGQRVDELEEKVKEFDVLESKYNLVSEDFHKLNEYNISVKEELRKKREKINFLNKEKLDFQNILEFEKEKNTKIENELRNKLQEAWSTVELQRNLATGDTNEAVEATVRNYISEIQELKKNLDQEASSSASVIDKLKIELESSKAQLNESVKLLENVERQLAEAQAENLNAANEFSNIENETSSLLEETKGDLSKMNSFLLNKNDIAQKLSATLILLDETFSLHPNTTFKDAGLDVETIKQQLISLQAVLLEGEYCTAECKMNKENLRKQEVTSQEIQTDDEMVCLKCEKNSEDYFTYKNELDQVQSKGKEVEQDYIEKLIALEEQLESATTSLEKSQQTISSLEVQIQTMKNLETMEDEQQTTMIKYDEILESYNQTKQELDMLRSKAQQDAENYTTELESIKGEVEVTKSCLNVKKEEIICLEEKLSIAQQTRTDGGKLESLMEEYEQLADNYVLCRNDLGEVKGKAKQDEETYTQTIDTLKKELKSAEELLAEKKEKMISLEEQLNISKQTRSEGGKLESLMEEYEQLADNYVICRNDLSQIQGKAKQDEQTYTETMDILKTELNSAQELLVQSKQEILAMEEKISLIKIKEDELATIKGEYNQLSKCETELEQLQREAIRKEESHSEIVASLMKELQGVKNSYESQQLQVKMLSEEKEINFQQLSNDYNLCKQQLQHLEQEIIQKEECHSGIVCTLKNELQSVQNIVKEAKEAQMAELCAERENYQKLTIDFNICKEQLQHLQSQSSPTDNQNDIIVFLREELQSEQNALQEHKKEITSLEQTIAQLEMSRDNKDYEDILQRYHQCRDELDQWKSKTAENEDKYVEVLTTLNTDLQLALNKVEQTNNEKSSLEMEIENMKNATPKNTELQFTKEEYGEMEEKYELCKEELGKVKDEELKHLATVDALKRDIAAAQKCAQQCEDTITAQKEEIRTSKAKEADLQSISEKHEQLAESYKASQVEHNELKSKAAENEAKHAEVLNSLHIELQLALKNMEQAQNEKCYLENEIENIKNTSKSNEVEFTNEEYYDMQEKYFLSIETLENLREEQLKLCTITDSIKIEMQDAQKCAQKYETTISAQEEEIRVLKANETELADLQAMGEKHEELIVKYKASLSELDEIKSKTAENEDKYVEVLSSLNADLQLALRNAEQANNEKCSLEKEIERIKETMSQSIELHFTKEEYGQMEKKYECCREELNKVMEEELKLRAIVADQKIDAINTQKCIQQAKDTELADLHSMREEHQQLKETYRLSQDKLYQLERDFELQEASSTSFVTNLKAEFEASMMELQKAKDTELADLLTLRKSHEQLKENYSISQNERDQLRRDFELREASSISTVANLKTKLEESMKELLKHKATISEQEREIRISKDKDTELADLQALRESYEQLKENYGVSQGVIDQLKRDFELREASSTSFVATLKAELEASMEELHKARKSVGDLEEQVITLQIENRQNNIEESMSIFTEDNETLGEESKHEGYENALISFATARKSAITKKLSATLMALDETLSHCANATIDDAGLDVETIKQQLLNLQAVLLEGEYCTSECKTNKEMLLQLEEKLDKQSETEFTKDEYEQLDKSYKSCKSELERLKRHVVQLEERKSIDTNVVEELDNLKREICEMRIQKTVQNMRVQAEEASNVKEIDRLKMVIKGEEAKNKHMKQELRRVTMDKADATFVNQSVKNNYSLSSVAGGSQVVMEVQVMDLQNDNYHLEQKVKRLESVQQQSIDHYKTKAQEWKNRCTDATYKLNKLEKKLATNSEHTVLQELDPQAPTPMNPPTEIPPPSVNKIKKNTEFKENVSCPSESTPTFKNLPSINSTRKLPLTRQKRTQQDECKTQ